VAGSIYLGGGGSAADESVLWRSMLAGKSRIVYWPFALAPERAGSAEEWLIREFAELDADVVVETWSDLSQHAPDQLASAELLFVGGGNTFRLLDHVRRSGFIDAVREFVDDGGDYYGGSAGAFLAVGDVSLALHLDENDLGLADLSALGLVRSLDVLPHFTVAQIRDAIAWSNERERTLLGIPDRSGVVVRAGKVEVLGYEPVYEVAEGQIFTRQPGQPWSLASSDRHPDV
jgi:dipeptidase E